MYQDQLLLNYRFRPLTLEDITGGGLYLQPAVYNLSYNEISNQYELNRVNDRFKLPDRIYGKAPKYARHFIEAFDKTNNNLGVILTGEKGTGKTELSKLICNMGIDEGIPVVTIYDVPNRSMSKIIEFIEKLGTVIIFFDEFGKNFYIADQERLLPLLSSSSNGKKLFLITENNYYSLSNYIRSRPGRARYHLDFQRLEPEVLNEYLENKQVDKKFAQEIKNFYNKTPKFTFDYLRALVEEHKLFPDMEFKDLIKILNIDELKKEFYVVVKNVFRIKDNGEKESVKYMQKNFHTVTKFKANARITIDIIEEVKDEKGDVLRKKILDTLMVSIDDLVKIKGNIYLLKKITPNGRYEIEMEELDEDKKKEIMDRNLIPVENNPMPNIFM